MYEGRRGATAPAHSRLGPGVGTGAGRFGEAVGGGNDAGVLMGRLFSPDPDAGLPSGAAAAAAASKLRLQLRERLHDHLTELQQGSHLILQLLQEYKRVQC